MNHEHDTQTINVGFWLYLMTDCLLFASLFATYAVLHGGTNGGVGMSDIVNMPYVLIQTLLLLLSSLTSGGTYSLALSGQWHRAYVWLGATAALGMGFLAMELHEFMALIGDGHSWQSSAFLSSFFTLVGTHGIHIAVGLIWAFVIMWHMYRRASKQGLTRQLMIFTMFWHFLELIWICIFTFVYAIGGLL